MKKVIVVSALAMLAAFSAGAQMMPDSTVQVIAYWDKGEKVMYKVENSTKLLCPPLDNERCCHFQRE